MMVLSILWSLSFAYQAAQCAFSEHADLKGVKQFDLISVNLDSLGSANLISFDAFDQHYQVQLVRNDNMRPLALRHATGNLAQLDEDLEQFYSHLNESCHFFGSVTNADIPSISKVSLSLCPQRGTFSLVW